MARVARSTEPVVLGSLTQRGARQGSCQACGSARVTQIAMTLTDGTPVDFRRCMACEHRSWTTTDGTVLDRETVLVRTQRER